MLALLYRSTFFRKSFFIVLFFVILIGFLVSKNVDFNLFFNRVASYKELDLAGRLEIWKGTLGIIKSRPVLGTGIGTFIHYFPRYRPVGFNMLANYAHNDYLEVWSDTGVFALLSVIFMLFLIIKKGFLSYKIAQSSFKKYISLGAAIGILSIAIHSLGDFNLRIPANALLFSVIAGVIFNLQSRKEGPERYLELRLNRSLLHVLRPLFIVGIIIWGLFISRLLIAEAAYKIANTKETEGRFRMLRVAAQFLPENSLYFKELGSMCIGKAFISLDREKELTMAREYYTLATEINPRDSWAWVGKGDALLYMARAEDAGDAYMKAVDLDPNNSYYLKKFGSALIDIGDVDNSIDILRRAAYIEKNRISPVAVTQETAMPMFYIDRGDYYYRRGDLENALKMYKVAEGLDFDNERTRIKIANVLERTGQEDQANTYKSSVSLARPIEALFLNSKARYLVSQDRYIEADELVEKALGLDPDDPITLQNKIDILQKQKRPFINVRPYIERLLDLNRDVSEREISGKDIKISFDLGEDGFMSRPGRKEFDFVLPLGFIDVKILASGTFANGEWSHMRVRLNSRSILSSYVYSDSDIEFKAFGLSEEGSNLIQIEFSNDYWDSVSGEDRNLKIKKIILEYRYPDYES